MLERLSPVGISQGSIITSCRASRYDKKSVHGLIITARCDIEHSKVSIYNYLPVVELADWLLLEGVEIVADRAIAANDGQLKSCLDRAGKPREILRFIDRTEILADLKKDTSKAGSKIAEQFEDANATIEMCQAIFSSNDLDERKSVLRNNNKLSALIVKELRDHRMADFHFLPRIMFGQPPSGYVINLREVRHISAMTAELVSDGLDPAHFSPRTKMGRMIRRDLNFSHSDHIFAMPLSQMRSPEIEFVLQRFSTLFGRIGVTDLDQEEIASSEAALKNILEPAE